MNRAWLVGLIITVILGSLALTEFSMLHRIEFGTFLILLLIIVYLVAAMTSLKKNTEKKEKQKSGPKNKKQYSDDIDISKLTEEELAALDD